MMPGSKDIRQHGWKLTLLLGLLGMALLLAGVTLSTRSALQRNEFLAPDFQVKAGVRAPPARFSKGELVGIWDEKQGTSGRIVLRESPSLGRGRLRLRVQPGESVVIQGMQFIRGEWVYYVRTAKGNKGWIAETSLKKLPV